MAKIITPTKPVAGEEVVKLWRHLVTLVDVVNTQSAEIALLKGIPPRRRQTDVAAVAFQGEYDSTKDYASGDTFIIAEDVTIAGIAVVAGYYGVPPAGTDDAGSWYGYVPANPTGNAVPQQPLPSIGAAPNDKFYARMIVAYC